jgi:tetratricopeptide (TPR) repeat protein
MIGFAWLQLRQAQEALAKGRLEDAQRLLGDTCLHGHKRVYDLLQQLARGYVERGERELKHENAEAAWQDLLHAEELKIADSGAEKLRQALTRQAVAEVKAVLQAGEPERAAEKVAELRQRFVRQKELDSYEEAAKHWLEARELASRGQFAEAQFLAERATRLLSATALDRFRDELAEKQRNIGPLLLELHEAAQHANWREVIALCEKVLTLAPQHGEARKLRGRAWKAIEPVTVANRPMSLQSTHDQPGEIIPQRFLLWIDGVGGYLVCMGSRVTLGQATSDSFVDIPLFADVSRLHATVTRDNEGYLLEAVRPVQVNGEPVDKALLRPNDRLTLGSGCHLRFRQPAPVSTSARIDITSGHRLPLTVDAVLLMADTLVLGPGSRVHVEMPDCKQNVVLYRQKDNIGIRVAGEFRINGQVHKERGMLGVHATVTGDDFALAIETIGTRMGRT